MLTSTSELFWHSAATKENKKRRENKLRKVLPLASNDLFAANNITAAPLVCWFRVAGRIDLPQLARCSQLLEENEQFCRWRQKEVAKIVHCGEHLVAIMLKAGRLKDLARVNMFLSQDAVDRQILLDIIRRHGLDKQWADCQSQSFL